MVKSFFGRKQSNEQRIDELLSAYLDGVLALEERVELEGRLQSEPALVTRLEGLRSTKKALAQLPQAEIPRNFVLSPAMVAAPRTAPRRQRRKWPAFGWATAAVALVFLLVFAGDLFVVSPSARPKTAALQREPVEKTLAGTALPPDEASAPKAIVRATQAETVFEAESASERMESEAVAEEEAPVAEVEITQEAEAGLATVAQPEDESTATADQENLVAARVLPTLPPGTEDGERTDSAAKEQEMPALAPAPEADAMTATPLLLLKRATPVPTSALGSVAGIEGGADASPEPTTLPTEDLGQPELEPPAETAPEADSETVAVVVPFDATQDEETDQDADRVLSWLRWIELGLAVIAIGLATATLVLRRREL